MTDRPIEFKDPEMQVMLNIVISLGLEAYVLRDRIRIIEKMLEAKGVISRADIEAYKPTPEEEEEICKDRDAFMSRFFRVFDRNLD
jgi:hypothetical protein